MIYKMFSVAVCTIAVLSVVAGSPSHQRGFKDDRFHSGSAYCEASTCRFVAGVLDVEKASAVATFNDTLLVTGWGLLDVKAGYAATTSTAPGPHTDRVTVFAAGFVEGVLTAQQIDDQMTNFFSVFSKSVHKLRAWLQKQDDWTEQMILEYKGDPFWTHVFYLQERLRGLLLGYQTAAKDNPSLRSRDWLDFRLLQASGDVGDIAQVTMKERKGWMETREWPYVSGSNRGEEIDFWSSRCSALVKLLPGFEDIFLAHSTFFVYQSMARVYKTYDVNLVAAGTVNKKISFSSYGGNLESIDDFYMLGGDMVMLETTNPVYNSSLMELVKPQSLLSWQRVLVANWLARGGQQWTELVARYNSGTYNNQYIVVDLRLVKPGQPLPDNVMWVAEQIPGLVESADLTYILKTGGYFPSYNIPYFDTIYRLSGYPDRVKRLGPDSSYTLAPRAKIFRRDQSKVKTLQDMKNLMRYNDYKNDPYSEDNPAYAICARADLLPVPSPGGCIDSKVTSLAMARQLRADIISGPTLGNDLPPFSWTGPYAKYSHVGLPEVYNFTFISVEPNLK